MDRPSDAGSDTPFDPPFEGLFEGPRWDTFGLLKEAYLALDERFADVAASVAAIDRSVLDLLIRVARSPDATARPTDLAEALSVAPSHVTRCLDEAAARDLIERRAHPTDGRSTLVTLTPAGAALLRRVESPLADVRDELIHDRLSGVELAALERTLRSLRDGARRGVRQDGAA
jgi:MarR family transcriptional regulator for hemolysin